MKRKPLKTGRGEKGKRENHAWLERAAWMTAASSTLTRGRGSEQTLETGPTYLAKLQCSRKTFGKLIRDGKGQPVAREGEKRRRNKGLIGSVHALILAITFLSEPLGLVLMWREDRTRFLFPSAFLLIIQKKGSKLIWKNCTRPDHCRSHMHKVPKRRKKMIVIYNEESFFFLW